MAPPVLKLLGRLPGFIKSLIGITIIVWKFSVKIGDLVRLVDDPDSEWFYQYRDRLFEVDDVFERHCRVRMLNVVNPQRYWFARKNNFRVVLNENR
tara:strand:- start:294 stop:581 length:288 start_codon:yes stop_codon:yes gene_type:complete